MSIKFNWWDIVMHQYLQWFETKPEFTLLSSQWSFPKGSNNPMKKLLSTSNCSANITGVDFPKRTVQFLTREVEPNENPSFKSHLQKNMEFMTCISFFKGLSTIISPAPPPPKKKHIFVSFFFSLGNILRITLTNLWGHGLKWYLQLLCS